MADVIEEQEVISFKKISSIDHVKKIKASCTWTIYNFSFLSVNNDDDSDDDNIESLTFSSSCGGNLKWKIVITNLHSEDHLAISFYIADYNLYPLMEGKVSILNSKREAVYAIAISEFENFTKFIKKSDLFDEKKKLLIEDKLVLLCEIQVFSKIEEWNTNTSKDKDCSCEIFRNRVGISKDFELLIDGKFSDIIFVVNQSSLHLHKIILATRSQVFSAMFQHDMLECTKNTVVITDTDHEVFKIVVEFIYTGHVKNIGDFPDTFLLQLLIAADKYDLVGLKNMCEFTCYKRLSLANAVDMLKFADFHNINELKNHVIKYIVAHGQDFINDPAFQSLSETHVHLLPQFIETRTNWTNKISNTDKNTCEQHNAILMIYPVKEKKYWNVSQVYIDKWSFRWVINDFKFYLCKNKWESVCSQTFNHKQYIWQLFLSLNNESDKEENNFLTLYIQVSTKDSSQYKIKAQYDISIINSKHEKLECIKSDIVTLMVNGNKIKMKRLKKNFLLCNAEELLPNDTLTIECNMKFGLDGYTNFCQTNFVDDCDYKHLLTFSSDLEHLLEGGQFSDITLIVNKKKFLLHRVILALRSPQLLATISQQLSLHNDQTAELVDVKPDVFTELLLFIYSGRINNLKDFAKDLYVEGEKYELEKLKCICETYFCNNLTVDNVCDIFVFAHLHKNKKIKDTAALFIVEELHKVVNTSGYKSITDSRPQLLKDIISKFHV